MWPIELLVVRWWLVQPWNKRGRLFFFARVYIFTAVSTTEATYVDQRVKRVIWTQVGGVEVGDVWPLDVIHTLCISCIYILRSSPFGFKRCNVVLVCWKRTGNELKEENTLQTQTTMHLWRKSCGRPLQALVSLIGTQTFSCGCA